MSNPNPVNLNNLDGRYAKPADVVAAISAQAVTDAGQYAPSWQSNTVYQAGQTVRSPQGTLVISNINHTSDLTYDPSKWSAQFGLLAYSNTNTTVQTTNTEWNLAAYYLPTDAQDGEVFSLDCWGTISNTSGVNKGFMPRFRVGSGILAPSSQFVLSSSSNTYYFRFAGRIIVGVGGRINYSGSIYVTDAASTSNWQSPIAATSLEGAASSGAGTAPGAQVLFTMQPSSGATNYTTALSSTFVKIGRAPTAYVYSGGARFIGSTQYAMQSPSKEWSYKLQGSVERFELRSGDYLYSDGSGTKQRVEWSAPTGQFNPSGQDIWISYAMYVEPGADSSSSIWCLLGQLHQTSDAGDDTSLSPPFSINYENGTLSSQLRYDANATSASAAGITTTVPWSISSFPRGQWSYFVHHIKFSWTGAGTYECWRNGVQLYANTAVNVGYNDTVGPYWKYGIYRANTTEGLAVKFANMEVGTSSLSSRVTSPLVIN